MWIKCKIPFVTTMKDIIYFNDPVNLNHFQRITKNDNHTRNIFRIEFDNFFVWTFLTKEDRDDTFLRIIRNFDEV